MAKKYIPHPDLIEDSFGILRLKIFNFFHVDYNLKKYVELAKKKVNVETWQTAKSEADAEGTRLDMASVSTASQDAQYRKDTYDSQRASYERNILNNYENEKKLPWYKKLFRFFKQQTADKIENTFDYIKEAKKDLDSEKFKEIYEKLNEAIEYAKLCGQKNLAMSIMDQRQVLTYEGVLAKNGFNKYVTEQDVIEFMKKANRGVAIEYIRYFTGFIPKEAAEAKKKADDLCIFDNYCVMYFDRNRSVLKLNEQQLKKAKDPIIFGLIRNSNRLYFIADWTTDDDDLTLDKFYETLGNAALQKEQELVEFKMNEIHELISTIHVDRNTYIIPEGNQEWVGDDADVEPTSTP